MEIMARKVGDETLRWIEHGSGEAPPVVLLHGIPTSPRLWRHVMPRLPGVRALAWEMFGYGGTLDEGEGHDLGLNAQADRLLAWLDAMELGPVILAGHDLGGGVAQIAAVRRPEAVAGLFLTNCVGYDSWPIFDVKVMRTLGPVTRHLPDAVFRQVFAQFITKGHDSEARADEALEVHFAPYAAGDGAAAMVRQADALRTEDTLAIADRLPSLGIPARIVWGVADEMQRIEYGERFARDLKAPIRRIEEGRHFTPEDHPEVVAEEIMALVAEIRTGAGAPPR